MQSRVLDHNAYETMDILDVAKDLDAIGLSLDQKHRMHRKVQFFLDIRGYFIINKLSGNYVEFGVYRGEMMYSAWKVLERTGAIQRYIGLDTFEGEPPLTPKEHKANPFAVQGDYASSLEQTTTFLARFLGAKLQLIQGDFRRPAIMNQCRDLKNPIILASIDCNLLSSIEKSIDFVLSNIRPGGVLFVDDFFINMNQGRCEVLTILEKAAKRKRLRLLDFHTYPPCAKAFIVVKP